MPLSEQTIADARRLVDRYPVARSALLPLLHLVQAEQNQVTDEGIAFCAEALGLTKAEVGAVATFYTMFKREPVGDYLVSICTNPTCKIAGAQTIYDRFVEKLGGHRDPETKVSVEHAECLGICDAAPVVQVNYEMYGPLDDAEADALLEGCRTGEPPVSRFSGQRPPTFAEVERELAGVNDDLGGILAVAARQQVEHELPPAYRSGETDIPVTHPGGDPKGIGGRLFAAQRDGTLEETPVVSASPDDTGTGAPADEVAEEGRGVAEERAGEVAARDGSATPPTPSDAHRAETGRHDQPADGGASSDEGFPPSGGERGAAGADGGASSDDGGASSDVPPEAAGETQPSSAPVDTTVGTDATMRPGERETPTSPEGRSDPMGARQHEDPDSFAGDGRGHDAALGDEQERRADRDDDDRDTDDGEG